MRAIESIVSWGTPDAMPLRKTSAPASASSQSIGAPAASTIRRAAVTHSGPMPSPGIRVTGMRVSVALTDASFAAAGRTCSS